MKSSHIVGLIVLAVAAFALVSYMDYEDAIAEETLYCVNVADGTWPDYRKEEDGIDYLEKCFKK